MLSACCRAFAQAESCALPVVVVVLLVDLDDVIFVDVVVVIFAVALLATLAVVVALVVEAVVDGARFIFCAVIQETGKTAEHQAWAIG